MTQKAKYAPGFLISVPQLMDPNFYHAVVLLIEHSSEGAMGLTINHPTDKSIQSLYEQMGRPWPGDERSLLMRGGPVQPENAWILHGPEDSVVSGYKITEELQLNTSLDALDELAKARGPFRLFVGYAGWGPGQLDLEIQQGAWILSDVDISLVFKTPSEAVWETSLRRMGIDPAMLVMGSGVH